MTGIPNTKNQDPLLTLAQLLHGGVEGIEASGQRALVESQSLPTDIRTAEGDDDVASYLALGFTFGEPDADDPLFRPATLPEGWEIRATEHAMWSDIVDERGLVRVRVFYKAAPYDRRAFMNLEKEPGRRLAFDWIYDEKRSDEPEFLGLLTPEELEQARGACVEFVERIEEYPHNEQYREPVERMRTAVEAAIEARPGGEDG